MLMTTDQIGANTACLANLPLQESVGYIRRLGFRCITLLAFAGTRHRYGDVAGFWFREMSDSERQWLKALVVDFDRLALHAPFADLPLFSYDPRVEELSMDRVKESIEAAGFLGAQVVIVHANPRSNLAVQDYWYDMVSTLRALGEYASDHGVRIGLETGFPANVDHFVDLLEAVGHHGVGATLDTGYLIRYVERSLWTTPEGVEQLNERLLEMTRQLGTLILHCHFHDVRAADWKDHEALGRGVLDFQSLLAELQTIGYEGILELELEEKDQVAALVESKRRLETLIRRLSRGQRRQTA